MTLPPGIAEWLLGRCLPDGIAERSIRGDLREEYDSIRTRSTRLHANVWYWLHALRLCARFTFGLSAHQHRSKRPRLLIESVTRDVRYAARSLVKNTGFSTIAVVTLALGIGASTVTFTLVNGVLIRPLPFSDPDRLVLLEELRDDGSTLTLSFPNFDDWRIQSRGMEGIAAIQFPIPATVLGAEEPVRGTVLRVSREFFDILGVFPWLGRAIAYDENREGGDPVAVLGYEFWQRNFGSLTQLDGFTITISGNPISVVGVMPPGFKLFEEGDVYLPLEQRPFRVRDSHNFRAVGRLASGVTAAGALEELETIAANIRASYPDETVGVGVSMKPLREEILGKVDRPLFLLMGAAGMLLIIACSNVASTLLARSTVRYRELAIRTAVGASRARLLSFLLTENLLLATLAGLAGLGLSSVALGVVRSSGVDLLPRLQTVSTDARVVLFAAAVTLFTTVAFGLLPALQSSLSGSANLRGGQRGETRRRTGFGGNALVAAESAIAVVLVVACGLLARSLQQILAEQTNFRPEGVLTVEMDLRSSRQNTDEGRGVLLEEIKAEFEALPGVNTVGYVSYLPTQASMMTGPVFKSPAPPARDPNRPGTSSGWRVVDTDYFTAMGIPLLRGRVFTAEDRGNAPPVVVINESLANRAFPGEDPIGQLIKFIPFWMEDDLTVIGVVAEARDWRRGPGGQPEAYVHGPQRPSYTRDMTAVIHTSGPPNSLVQPVRERLRAVAPSVPGTIRTMDSIVNASIKERTFILAALGSFAVLSLILAAIGIYGVVSYSVSSQTREIGIKLALGAEASVVRTKIFYSSIAVVSIGVAFGIAVSLLSGRVMESQLYGVSSRDLATLAAAPVVLLAAAAFAITVPVFRYTRVDPVEVMRAE
jgi:putative ABC transport system permease protein